MAETERSQEFMDGFYEALKLAEQVVQKAREGVFDTDLRSIKHRISSLEPDTDLEAKDG